MYSLEQKQLAVQTYNELYSYRKTIQVLGYPGSRNTLKLWVHEYSKNGSIEEKTYTRKKSKYSQEQIDTAIQYYIDHGNNVTQTCINLGYPCRNVLNKWLDEAHVPRTKSKLRNKSPLRYSTNDKIVAAIKLVSRDGAAEAVVNETGINRTSLYKWKKQLLPEGQPLIMSSSLDSKTTDAAQITELKEQAKELKRQIHLLQLEKDALEQATFLIKKAKGINLQTLANCEKAIIIDALRDKYCLNDLLNKLSISKSSYFYQHNALMKPDKYVTLRSKIREIFFDSGESYGYRRIYLILKRNYITVSEKVVRRLMKEESLIIKKVRIRKYSSYKGEITPAVPNLINRNFKASKPNQKWLTDITEFHIPAGKIYLSPIIDCFDGLPVAWTIGTSPCAELVNTMLDTAIETLPTNAHPIVHSDRGCHYRWPGWIERMNNAGLTRSMSKKGVHQTMQLVKHSLDV